MDIFKGQSLIHFMDTFQSDQDCLKYLASYKWSSGYRCRKCGCSKFTIRKKNQARDCNSCHHIESPTAHTIFHKVKFGIRKAFVIVYEMSTSTKSISASQLSKRMDVSRKTAWFFMHKVRHAMKSSELYPIEGKVFVDEFVYGGKEELKQGRSYDSKKKKVVAAVEVDEKGGVKRAYFKTIDNYSSQELQKIFEPHVSNNATVITDKWTGYTPLKSQYNITQIKSNISDFFEINNIIHQLKSNLRSVHSWVHKGHFQKYLDEFSYRINRSIHKQTIFDNLIKRMLNHQIVSYKDIKISS